MLQAVKSVTLGIAFDTVASFQPTGDLDDGARSEEKKNSRFFFFFFFFFFFLSMTLASLGRKVDPGWTTTMPVYPCRALCARRISKGRRAAVDLVAMRG